MKTYINVLVLLSLFGLMNCTKSDFLNVKPNSGIMVPNTLEDVEKLLNNNLLRTFSSGLATVSADEYIVSEANWNTVPAIERNASVWNRDVYEGEEVLDWKRPYTVVFYVNNALAVLSGMDSKMQSTDWFKELYGWALFQRAYANYELARLFCKSYDENTADTDLGIPIRITPGIDVIVQRSTLRDTYTHILNDIKQAIPLLGTERSANLMKPNKITSYSLLARIYLDMGKYVEAESCADSALDLYNILLDYNTLDFATSAPFSSNNMEIIFGVTTVGRYVLSSVGSMSALYTVNPELFNLYDSDDLRLKVFFLTDGLGKVVMKKSYIGLGLYGFTGLTTDELYLIKAECLARKDKDEDALEWIHDLLQKRYATGKAPMLEELQSRGPVLETVLEERRKELVWRSIRWSDIKRLNRDGKGIELGREIGDKKYTLPANDPRYVLPIPDDEVAFSGLTQNQR